jgi:hypothetical protein
MAVGYVGKLQTRSGSDTVIVLVETVVTRVKGPIWVGEIKSPTNTNDVQSEAVVMTPVNELYAVALTLIDVGIAPTH